MVMCMTGKSLFIVAVSLLVAGILNAEAASCRGCGCNSTYSGYCNNQRWGWYGARKTVPSAEEARRDLVEYYADSKAKVGKIIEKPGYFEAEILDNDNKLLDRVIIHKRSGRIRSIR